MAQSPDESAVGVFGPAARAWFDSSFAAPTEVQRRGWQAIAAGRHALLIAPTGSGKTLAAFLYALDRVARRAPGEPAGVRVLYVSPLKALVYDIERNLRSPLAGIERTAERLELPVERVRVAVRTGDTPQSARARQARSPAEVLVTTPESLFLLLGSKARATLASVHTVIIDELHVLAGSKRGAHLSISLERLCELTAVEPQRIGLSATLRPPELAARFLAGDRAVEVVDASARPALDLVVSVPVPDMQSVPVAPRSDSLPGALQEREQGRPPLERGMWAVIQPDLLAQIRAHRSTIVFVNSRGLCERLTQRLNELAGEELVFAHHGSLSLDRRAEIEEALKRGDIRAIVATSSLELGVDMGAVDLVVLVESPGSVARALQRVGRAGHAVGEISRGRIYPKHRGDLLECAVVAARMREGAIESLHVPRAPLDVLAQQVVAMVCDGERTLADVERVVRRAAPYRELPPAALAAVVDMLGGHYPSGDFSGLRPMLAHDRSSGLLRPRRGAALVSRVNAGTIPDRGTYAVHLGADGPRIGELDEEMVFETRRGENITLGASTWRVQEITRDRVLVTPAPGEPGKLPFWRGDGPGRPLELGLAVGVFIRELGRRGRGPALAWLREAAPLDEHAAGNLVDYVHEQKAHTGTLPSDRAVTVERFRDELGDWRVCLLAPFGSRVLAPWAMAVQRRLAVRSGFDVQVMWSDDGLVLRFADTEQPPPLDVLLPDPEELDTLLTEQLADTALFAGLFRENAARALLLPRRRPDRRNPLWAQRLKAQQLLAEVRRYPSFPIVVESFREALGDLFDLDGLKDLLERIRRREIRVDEVETASASPFARSLVFAYVAAYMYEQDAPLAERRAQALTLDRSLLAELLGQAELRDLIDAVALAELETELRQAADDTRARDADELHDLLRRLGDRTIAELAECCESEPAAWLESLVAERRAVLVTVAGESRWIAGEDAGLYRDALGVPPPRGLPASCVASVDDALSALLRRHARGHGPFLATEVAARYSLHEAQVRAVLEMLTRDGTLVHGELRPGGSEPEWCDAEVLRRLRRRTLARLRDEAAAVDGATLARFLPAWHGIESKTRGGLEEAVAKLEGLALPWSLLAGVLLPARVSDFTLEKLDSWCASGRLVWVGRGALGRSDGRVALYRRDNVQRLLEPPGEPPTGPLHAMLLAHLRDHGASFLTELEEATRLAMPAVTRGEFQAALWGLVWSGHVSNDTTAPLRALGRRGRAAGQFAGGRWSLVETLTTTALADTERALAQAHMLLERYGVVARECVQAEALPGGYVTLYRVLRGMEDAGRVRRGHFVEGLSGAQFALPGAVERLRGHREARPVHDAAMVIAAADPANPYGALLAWPATTSEAARPRRVAGAWLVCIAGRPVILAAAGGRQVLTFAGVAPGQLDSAFAHLAHLPRGRRRRALLVERIDDLPARESPYAARLLAAGFTADYGGLLAPSVL